MLGMSNTGIKGPWALGGERMAELRSRQEITRKELAEQAGLPDARWVADVEAGRRAIPSVYFKCLARAFGLSVADFAALCLKYYDANAYSALFGDSVAQPSKVAA